MEEFLIKIMQFRTTLTYLMFKDDTIFKAMAEQGVKDGVSSVLFTGLLVNCEHVIHHINRSEAKAKLLGLHVVDTFGVRGEANINSLSNLCTEFNNYLDTVESDEASLYVGLFTGNLVDLIFTAEKMDTMSNILAAPESNRLAEVIKLGMR